MTTQDIASKVILCSKKNVFCAYEFLIYMSEDNKTLFEYYFAKLKQNGCNLQEFYPFDFVGSKQYSSTIYHLILEIFKTLQLNYSTSEIIYEIDKQTTYRLNG